MRGNLSGLGKILAALSQDLTYPGASEAETAAAIIMGALHIAIVLERTSELAAIVAPWSDEHSAAAVRKLLERAANKQITSPPTGG